jgi:hypothetical protein
MRTAVRPGPLARLGGGGVAESNLLLGRGGGGRGASKGKSEEGERQADHGGGERGRESEVRRRQGPGCPGRRMGQCAYVISLRRCRAMGCVPDVAGLRPPLLLFLVQLASSSLLGPRSPSAQRARNEIRGRELDDSYLCPLLDPPPHLYSQSPSPFTRPPPCQKLASTAAAPSRSSTRASTLSSWSSSSSASSRVPSPLPRPTVRLRRFVRRHFCG